MATYGDLGELLDEPARALLLDQARVARDSPALQAWTAAAYVRDEVLIAAVLTERLGALQSDGDPADPRPRMIAAVATAAIRLSLETWVASDGTLDLTTLLQDAVKALK